MSEMLDAPEYDAEANRRRRAIWGLTVLACVAVIFVSLLVLFGGGGGPSNHSHGNAVPTGPAVTYETSSHASASASKAASSTAAATTAPTTSLPASPARTGNPCNGQASCLVSGDGGALAALNSFRAQHGLAPVAGGVSTNAQTCALNQGSGSTCVPHYAWTGLPTQNGAEAIQKISQFGSSWMLDSGIQRIDIGWAYVGGQYQCVLLKSP